MPLGQARRRRTAAALQKTKPLRRARAVEFTTRAGGTRSSRTQARLFARADRGAVNVTVRSREELRPNTSPQSTGRSPLAPDELPPYSGAVRS